MKNTFKIDIDILTHFQMAGGPVGPWRLLGLLLPLLLRGVALSYQWVQSHHSTKPLEPRAFWPLHLGFWHLLHIWPACWGGFFQPKTWRSHFSARLNQEYLGSCMHCWDISEFLFLPFFFCIFHRKTFTRDKVVFVDEFLGFNIYLHDKGQFWPGLEMGEFISFQKLGNWWCKMADPMCFQVELG